MTKAEKLVLIKVITSRLEESQLMWDKGQPHAMIVGFLEGTLKTIRTELEESKDNKIIK